MIYYRSAHSAEWLLIIRP